MSAHPATAARGFRTRVTPAKFSVMLLAVLLAAAIVYPIAKMLLTTFVVDGSFTTTPFSSVRHMPGIGETIKNTFFIVFVAGSLAVSIAAFFAWVNERTDANMGWLSQALPIMPILVPPVASVIGWVLLLSPGAGAINVFLRNTFGLGGTEGPLNIFTMYGLVWLYVLELIPFAYLVISSAMRNLDPALEEASRMSGAGPLRTLFKVTLPAVKPQIASSALLVLVVGFALFSAAGIVGTPARIDVLSAKIIQLLRGSFPPKTAEAVVLSSIILVVILAAWLVQRRISNTGHHAQIGGKGARGSRVALGAARWPIRVLMLAYLGCAIVLPVSALLFVSVQNFWQANVSRANFTLDSYRDLFAAGSTTRLALTNSLTLGAVAATVGLVLAFFIGMLGRRMPGRLANTLDGTARLPAALSHIVLAMAILLTFGGPPFNLGGTLTILFVGYLIIYLPQGTVAATSTINQVGDQLFEASYMSGAGEGRTLRRIALPLMGPGLASAWVLLFVLTAGDLTASVLLSSTSTPTVGSTIFDIYENGTFPLIAAMALVVTVVCSTVVLTVLRFANGRFTEG